MLAIAKKCQQTFFFTIIFAYNTNNDNNTIKQLTDTILQLQKKKRKKIYIYKQGHEMLS